MYAIHPLWTPEGTPQSGLWGSDMEGFRLTERGVFLMFEVHERVAKTDNLVFERFAEKKKVHHFHSRYSNSTLQMHFGNFLATC